MNEHESIDAFERELSESLTRRPAPPSLKRHILAERERRAAEARASHRVIWMRLAASLVLAAILAGIAGWQWQRIEERRRGEAARRQVMTALGITARALNKVQAQLELHNESPE